MVNLELLNFQQILSNSKTKGIDHEDSIKWIKIKREWTKKIEEFQEINKELVSTNNIKVSDSGKIDTDNTSKEDLSNYNKSFSKLLTEEITFSTIGKLKTDTIFTLRDLNDWDSEVLDLILKNFGNELE